MGGNFSDVKARVERVIEKHRLPGASVAILMDDIVHTAAAGSANLAAGIDMTPDTVMHIGSITKLFTTTLAMQLVDQGVVDLESPVSRYIPELHVAETSATSAITLKMLLNHTSGIDGDMLPDHGHDEETVAKAIGRFAELGQVHAPGGAFSYCNPGMVIAGYLSERLSGQSWYKLVRRNIFEPLGMEHAAALPEEALLYRASVGHYLEPSSNTLSRTSTAFLPLSYGPAGTTLMMTPADLIKFAQMHIDLGVGPGGERLLSTSSAKAMQTTTIDNRDRAYTEAGGVGADGIGLGWMIFSNGLLTHIGGGPGFVSALYVHPELRFAIAILTNAEHGLHAIKEIADHYLEVVGAAPTPRKKLAPRGIALSKDQALQVAGVYEDILRRFEVTFDGTSLFLSQTMKIPVYESISLAPTPPKRLDWVDDDLFLLEGDGSEQNDLTYGFRSYNFFSWAEDDRKSHLGFGLHIYPRVA